MEDLSENLASKTEVVARVRQAKKIWDSLIKQRILGIFSSVAVASEIDNYQGWMDVCQYRGYYVYFTFNNVKIQGQKNFPLTEQGFADALEYLCKGTIFDILPGDFASSEEIRAKGYHTETSTLSVEEKAENENYGYDINS